MRKLRQGKVPSVSLVQRHSVGAELRCKPRRCGCDVMVLPVLPSGWQGEGCEVCTMQGWQVTRQCHHNVRWEGWGGPLVDLRCSGEGTCRSHTGEGSFIWAVEGARDSMPIFTYLVTFSIFLLCLFTFLSLKCMGMGNCIPALDNHRVYRTRWREWVLEATMSSFLVEPWRLGKSDWRAINIGWRLTLLSTGRVFHIYLRDSY